MKSHHQYTIKIVFVKGLTMGKDYLYGPWIADGACLYLSGPPEGGFFTARVCGGEVRGGAFAGGRGCGGGEF